MNSAQAVIRGPQRFCRPPISGRRHPTRQTSWFLRCSSVLQLLQSDAHMLRPSRFEPDTNTGGRTLPWIISENTYLCCCTELNTLETPNTVFFSVVGGNPSVSHPRRNLRNLASATGNLKFVNPIKHATQTQRILVLLIARIIKPVEHFYELPTHNPTTSLGKYAKHGRFSLPVSDSVASDMVRGIQLYLPPQRLPSTYLSYRAL